MADQMELSSSLSGLHDIFHVSQLQKCVLDPLQPIIPDTFLVEVDIIFYPQPRCIIDY